MAGFPLNAVAHAKQSLSYICQAILIATQHRFLISWDPHRRPIGLPGSKSALWSTFPPPNLEFSHNLRTKMSENVDNDDIDDILTRLPWIPTAYPSA